MWQGSLVTLIYTLTNSLTSLVCGLETTLVTLLFTPTAHWITVIYKLVTIALWNQMNSGILASCVEPASQVWVLPWELHVSAMLQCLPPSPYSISTYWSSSGVFTVELQPHCFCGSHQWSYRPCQCYDHWQQVLNTTCQIEATVGCLLRSVQG